MGLFSSKTTIYVSSSAYNMAGDEAFHAKPTKAIVVNTVLSGRGDIAENLRVGLVNGPGSRPKRFFRWAKDNHPYDMPLATISAVKPLDKEKAYAGLAPLLSLGENQTLRILSSVLDDGDVNYWAEVWVANNHASSHRDDWAAEWDVGAQKIVVYVGTNAETEEPIEAVRLDPHPDLFWAAGIEGRKLIYLTYQIITQDPATRKVVMGPLVLYTYRMGSGNVVFDALGSIQITEPEFFPVLPIRIEKTFVDQPAYEDVLPGLKKGYRRLTGDKIENLIEQIRDSDDEEGGSAQNHLVDLDGIYVVQGVSLNTDSSVGREYIYRFLRTLMEKQYEEGLELSIGNTFLPREEVTGVGLWNRWLNVHANGIVGSPLYGKPPPENAEPPYRPKDFYELRIRSENLKQADMRIRWNWIEETVHLGNAKRYDANTTRTLARVGEYWIHSRKLTEPRDSRRRVGLSDVLFAGRANEELNVFHQFSRDHYRRLRCLQMEHRNHVYGNTVDAVSAYTAMSDEDESPFLVPLHMPTLRKMGSAKGAQLSMGSSYLVFNSYKKVKRRWYQRGIFKVILVIVSIVASVLFTGFAGLGAASGVLGTNAAVGALLGASAGSAAVVGAIANGIAGAILSTLASTAAQKLFKGKLGAILGTLISFVAMTYGSQFGQFGNLNVDWGKIINPNNFLRLTSVLSESYTRWLYMDTLEIYDRMEELGRENKDALSEVEKLQKEILGMTSGQIDPILFTNASEYFGESSESFLSRTLMSGGDIAQLSFDMVENFAALSLELPRAEFPIES